jgi:hypothetical protein
MVTSDVSSGSAPTTVTRFSSEKKIGIKADKFKAKTDQEGCHYNFAKTFSYYFTSTVKARNNWQQL